MIESPATEQYWALIVAYCSMFNIQIDKLKPKGFDTGEQRSSYKLTNRTRNLIATSMPKNHKKSFLG